MFDSSLNLSSSNEAARQPRKMSESWVAFPSQKFNDNLAESEEVGQIDSPGVEPIIPMIKSLSLPVEVSTQVNPLQATVRDETYFEKLYNFGTNFRYNLGGLGQADYFGEGNKNAVIYLLGEKYEVKADQNNKVKIMKAFQERFEQIIWFSYRKNFPALVPQKRPAESHISDTGWGCMLRACQMMFAECLKRGLIFQQLRDSNQNLPVENPKDLNKKIISWFLDCEVSPQVSPYSIQTISQEIYQNFETPPGIWLKPSLVLFALQKIHKEFCQSTFANLNMEIYLEGTIYCSKALNKMAGAKISEEEHKKSQKEASATFDYEDDFEIIEDDEIQKLSGQNLRKCIPRRKESEKMEESKLEDSIRKQSMENSFEATIIEDNKDLKKLLGVKWDKSLVLYVLAKIGLDKPNDEYLPFIKEILSYPESVGMIGGKPGLAYYIVGYNQDSLLYLDPHFVQETVKSQADLAQNMSTYSCQGGLRQLAFGQIDTSVAFGFFIQDETSFKEFITRFKKSCEKKESFLGIDLSAKEDSGEFVECDEDEEDFEMVFVN